MAIRLNCSSWLALANLLLAAPAGAAGFLAAGPGARAAALGGAFTGLADDSSAIYYNPAGLAGQRGAVMLEHAPIDESGSGLNLNDGQLDFIGVHYPGPWGAFGFGAVQFEIGGIEGRQTLSDPARDFTATQRAFFAPYSIALGRLSLGVTGKAVVYDLGAYHDTGYGADAGALATLWQGDSWLGRELRATAGCAIRNLVAPSLKLYQDQAALERTLAAGVAFTALVRERYDDGSYDTQDRRVLHDRWTLSCDVTRGNSDTPLSPAAGVEYSYLDRYAVRGGYGAGGRLTIGFGFGGGGSSFRFAYAADIAALAPQHRFTVSWLFTEPAAGAQSAGRRGSWLSQERLKDRFVREGQFAAAQNEHEAACADFEKAWVLDPQDRVVAGLAESSREDGRLAGVKARLEEAKRQSAQGNGVKAAALAMEAVAFDPESRDAAAYAAKLRYDMRLSGAALDFESARRRKIDAETQAFRAAFTERDVPAMGRALRRIKALDPEEPALWRQLETDLADSREWLIAQHTSEALRAFNAQNAAAMARAVRRLRRIAQDHKDLPELEDKLRKIARTCRSSSCDAGYLRQLYDTAATEYVMGDCDSAAQTLVALLQADAAHAEGNALVDRMRAEGKITQDQEP